MGAPGSVPTVASYPPMPREEEEEEEGAPLPAGAGAGAAGRAKEAEARGRRRAAYHAIAGEALMVPFLWPSWFLAPYFFRRRGSAFGPGGSRLPGHYGKHASPHVLLPARERVGKNVCHAHLVLRASRNVRNYVSALRTPLL